MKIRDEYRSLDTLLPDAANYNRHPEHEVRRLAEMIRKVGFTAPVLVDAATGALVAGHRRRLALLLLRNEHSAEPVGIEPGWRVPCRVGEWSDIQRLKVLIGDNPTAERIDYDLRQLTTLLEQVHREDGLEGSGYDENDLDTLLAELVQYEATGSEGAEASPDEAEDEAAEESEAPRSKAKPAVLRPLLLVEQVSVIERALAATGMRNRGAAFVQVCRDYLDHAERAERQQHRHAEDQTAPEGAGSAGG